MTNKKQQTEQNAWIIDALYGELDPQQQSDFEQALKDDPQLKQSYDRQSAFNLLMEKGSRPYISEERMQGVRWSTLRKLRQRDQPSMWEALKKNLSFQIPVSLQIAGMAMMFVFGFLLHPVFNNAGQENDALQGALSFVDNDDYQIVDVRLESYDQNAGDVQLSFALNSESQVSGNIANPQIRRLLTQSLHADSGDGVRLQLTELFGNHLQNQDVRDALIFTLLNDPNPGVRYNAVENLVKVAQQHAVRQALRQALVNDVNPGIRIEAFLALTSSKKIEPALLKALKNHSIDDANTLIRERTKKILEHASSQTDSQTEKNDDITI